MVLSLTDQLLVNFRFTPQNQSNKVWPNSETNELSAVRKPQDS